MAKEWYSCTNTVLQEYLFELILFLVDSIKDNNLIWFYHRYSESKGKGRLVSGVFEIFEYSDYSVALLPNIIVFFSHMGSVIWESWHTVFFLE